MWGGQSMGRNTQAEIYLDDFEWYLKNHEKGKELILQAIDELKDKKPKYIKRLLKDCEEPEIYKACLPYVDDRYCFLLILDYRFDGYLHTKVEQEECKVRDIINKIRIRKYLKASLKALDAVLYYCIAEDVAVGVMKELIENRLDTMDRSLDFILD